MTRQTNPRDFNPFSADYAENWMAIYSRWRQLGSVLWSSQHSGFWIATSYPDVVAVSRDDGRFSSDHDPHHERQGYQGVGIPRSVGSRSIPMEMDPPESDLYRSVLAPFFSRANVLGWETWIAEQTRQHLHAGLSNRRIDLAQDVALPVLARFAVRFLGLDETVWPWLTRPYHVLVTTPPDHLDYATAVADLERSSRYIESVISSAADHPATGLIQELKPADPAAIRPTPGDILGIAQLVLFGGIDSTVALIVQALKWLAENPSERNDLRAGKTDMVHAVEEFLRFFSPVPFNARTVTEATCLGGQELQGSDRMFISWAAANHDPQVFDRPDECLLRRPMANHVAFGRGAHYCLGAHFARMIARVMIGEVIVSCPDFELAPDGAIPYRSGAQLHGYENLVVVLPSPVD